MTEIFQRYRPSLILHAAEHKHVPMMEAMPWPSPYDDRFVAHVLEFFERTLQAPSPLPPEDQRWKFREAATTVSLVGGLLVVIPCAGLLLCLPFFAAVRQQMPQALPAPSPSGITQTGAIATGAASPCCSPPTT